MKLENKHFEIYFLGGFRDRDETPYIPMNERFAFETNKRNSLNIIDQNGFQYMKKSKVCNKNGEDRWVCYKRRQGCKVVVKTIGEFIVAQKNYHICNNIIGK